MGPSQKRAVDVCFHMTVQGKKKSRKTRPRDGKSERGERARRCIGSHALLSPERLSPEQDHAGVRASVSLFAMRHPEGEEGAAAGLKRGGEEWIRDVSSS